MLYQYTICTHRKNMSAISISIHIYIPDLMASCFTHTAWMTNQGTRTNFDYSSIIVHEWCFRSLSRIFRWFSNCWVELRTPNMQDLNIHLCRCDSYGDLESSTQNEKKILLFLLKHGITHTSKYQQSTNKVPNSKIFFFLRIKTNRNDKDHKSKSSSDRQTSLSQMSIIFTVLTAQRNHEVPCQVSPNLVPNFRFKSWFIIVYAALILFGPRGLWPASLTVATRPKSLLLDAWYAGMHITTGY